jgi:hypothetical protein
MREPRDRPVPRDPAANPAIVSESFSSACFNRFRLKKSSRADQDGEKYEAERDAEIDKSGLHDHLGRVHLAAL